MIMWISVDTVLKDRASILLSTQRLFRGLEMGFKCRGPFSACPVLCFMAFPPLHWQAHWYDVRDHRADVATQTGVGLGARLGPVQETTGGGHVLPLDAPVDAGVDALLAQEHPWHPSGGHTSLLRTCIWAAGMHHSK